MAVRERRVKLKPIGLLNYGNNCFFIASMQCFLSLHRIVSYYHDTEFPLKCHISLAFKDCIELYKKGKPFNPEQVLSKMRHIIKLFNGKQQDAHEFLIHFVDYLFMECEAKNSLKNNLDVKNISFIDQEQFLKTRERNIIAQTFFTLDKRIVTCLVCRTKSETIQYSNILSVPVCDSTQDSINKYFEDELLMGTNAWRCKGCNRQHSTSIKHEALVASNVLVIQLQRFTNYSTKNTHTVAVSEVVKVCNENYRLIGVVCHIGTLTSGHYFAEAKRDGMWNHYDDSSVSDQSKNYSGSQPYIIFYSKN